MPITPQCRARQLATATKHGGYAGGREQPEHYVWRTMIARCSNPNAKDYAKYGGRGISVCARWMVYENFLADMGPRPSRHHSIDRIHNEMDYDSSNCRWATRSQQQKNKRNTILYEQDGRRQTIAEWADELGISRTLACWRWKSHGTFIKGQTWIATNAYT